MVVKEIVVDDAPSKMAIVTDKDKKDTTVFGQKKEIGEGAEETAVDTADQIQQRNRITGFIILLVIAIVLAIWYVREKKQAEIETKKEEKIDKDKKNKF